MIKKCHICAHVGELTWRDGKYYCAMCGSEIAETEPQYQAVAEVQPEAPAVNAVCPICKNNEGNQFVGTQYRCKLCGTMFDLGDEYYIPQQAPATPSYGYGYNYNNSAHIQELQKQKDRKIVTGIVFLFLFWPASVYFFYKAHKINQEIKSYQR